MTTAAEVCEDLRGLDGCLGAGVWVNEEWLAASLPSDFDAKRLRVLGTGLSRLEHLSSRAGYARAASVLQWDALTLFSWPLGAGGTLMMLAEPSAERGVLEFSAALAMEELLPLVPDAPAKPAAAPARPMPPPPPKRAAAPLPQTAPVESDAKPTVVSAPTTPATPADLAEIEKRLQLLEELILSELGPTGHTLLQRVRRSLGAPQAPTDAWLGRLRSAVLAELKDPIMRAVVAASVIWLPV